MRVQRDAKNRQFVCQIVIRIIVKRFFVWFRQMVVLGHEINVGLDVNDGGDVLRFGGLFGLTREK